MSSMPQDLDPDVWEAISLSINGYIDVVDVVADVFEPGREDDRAQVQQTAAMASYAMIVTARDAGEDSQVGSLCRDVGESLLLLAGANSREQMDRLPISSAADTRARAHTLGIRPY
jgi:hypothetical protein